jgi:hypothetical protein
MKANVIALALSLIVVSACEKQPAPVESSLADALDTITEEKLSAHLTYLADDSLEGREAGQPGYGLAATYVTEQYAEMGLEPGGSDGWYQQVPLATYLLDPDSPTMIVHRDGIDTALEYKEQFAMSGDQVRGEDLVRAEVVYVGFGVHAPNVGYSDYDGVDVEGKIVALFDNAPSTLAGDSRAHYSSRRVKAQAAVSRGAIGSIALRSKRSVESYPWDRVRQTAGKKPGMAWVDLSGAASGYFPEIQGSVYLSADAATQMMAGTPMSFEGARAATESDTPASVPLGIEVTLARKTTHERIESPNVIGVVRGTDPELADEYVVFSAHLDHTGIGEPVEGGTDKINNGAYDNAMGIALMLEAARAIAAAPPRRSIMFIGLTAEEKGLLGSDYFAHYPTVPSASIVANVNLDMPLFLFPVAELVGFGAEHSSLQAPMSAAAAAEGFVLAPDPMPEENFFVRSDQYSFVKKGIPSSYLDVTLRSSDPNIDGEALVKDHLKNHYHKPSDDLSRPVDWDSAVRFARANARIGLAIANDDDRPTWNEGDFFGEMFAPED